MGYVIGVVQPARQREATISSLKMGATETFAFFGLDQEESLPVIRVPLGLPLYRMDNGRTQSEQLELVAEEGLPDDYFAVGQENREVQQRQHELLVEFAKDGGGEDGRPIRDVLGEQGQREPIVVSVMGVVLNGNRRLSAMRDLYALDPARFGHFANVKVAVQPKRTVEQEFEIEVRLQMTPRTLLEYTWINDALMVEKAVLGGRSTSEVAAMQGTSSQDVNLTLAALIEARRYLDDLGKPNAFSLVKNMKQFFRDLAKSVKEKAPLDADMARVVAASLASSSDTQGRVYDYNRVIAGDLTDLIDQVIEAVGGIDTVNATQDPGELELDLGTDGQASKVEGLLAALKNPDTRDLIREAIVDAAEAERDKQQTKSRADKPLRIIKSARSRLDGLEIDRVPGEDLLQVVAQLKELKILAGQLQDAAQARIDRAEVSA